MDEVAYTVIRTARSEIVKDVMDYSAAICDAKGEMVAQAKTIAQHLGAIPEAMAAVQAKWGGQLQPGDAVIMNDPYSGGMHLPDIFMFFPIFDGAEILAWSVVICHHTDVGGRVPGSNAADSTEIYQEGLRIPPLKLFRAGVMDEALEAVIGLNVRVPDRVIGDLRAQYAACQVGAREIGRLVARYGAQTDARLFRRLARLCRAHGACRDCDLAAGHLPFHRLHRQRWSVRRSGAAHRRGDRARRRHAERGLGRHVEAGARGDQLDAFLHQVQHLSQCPLRFARRHPEQRRRVPLHRRVGAGRQRAQSEAPAPSRRAH